MESIHADIQQLIARYGIRKTHLALLSMMKEEHEYLHEYFNKTDPVVSPHNLQTPPEPVVQTTPVKKERKQRMKKVMPQVVNEPAVLAENEVKDVVVVTSDKFRDPKEMKEYQKTAEDARRKLNEEAGLQLHQILTKENLKQWVEVEGHTYAWVAREKAGCPDTQVAATAQMMGVKSKISRKRGMIMSGK